VEDLGHHPFYPSQVDRPHAVTQAHPVTDMEAAELLPILLTSSLMYGLGQPVEMSIQDTVFDESRDACDDLLER